MEANCKAPCVWCNGQYSGLSGCFDKVRGVGTQKGGTASWETVLHLVYSGTGRNVAAHGVQVPQGGDCAGCVEIFDF